MVLAAYRRFGCPDFLSRLAGAFSLAVIDVSKGVVVLAVDRMGIGRLVYRATPDGLAFSTSVAAVVDVSGVPTELDAQSIYNYLFLHMVPAPDTIYAGVRKLPAATFAQYQRGRLEIQRYWMPRFTETTKASFAELRRELRFALNTAVRRCAPDERTGAFLSGGLDSSTVAGVLSLLEPGGAQTFSIGFGEEAYDELRFARIAVRHFGCHSHEHEATPADIVRTFSRIASAYDEPFGNSSAVPTLLCAELAASHGVTHLLAGDGGDELFAGNERYAKQLLFESYYRLPGWARSAFVEPLVKRINAETGFTPLRKIRSFVDQARIRLPSRLETWNFMYRNGNVRILDPDFLSGVDPARTLAQLQQLFDSAPSNSVQDKMLYYDWQLTLADNDLRKVCTMCDLAGVRVSFPMLDEAVVDLAVRVPPNMRMRGLQLRSFYKQAMEGFLPRQIIKKTKHGFGLPFGVWMHRDARLSQMILDYLTSLKSWRIVRSDFLDNLVQRHRESPSSYLGYPIWSYAVLSAWLDSHRRRRPSQPLGSTL